MCIVIAAIALSAGCIDYEEKITLRKDGSGYMTIHYFTDESTIEEEKMEEEELPFSFDQYSFDQKEIEDELADENIRVEKVESYTEEGKRHLIAKLFFKNINKIPHKWIFENRELQFTKESGFLTFRSVLLLGGEETGEGEFDEFVKAILADYKFKFTVEMPSKIVEASAGSRVEDNTVMWEFPLSSLMDKERIEMYAKIKVGVLSPIVLWGIIGIVIVVGIITFSTVRKKKSKK